MLSEQEREWLESRELSSCRRCEFEDECQRAQRWCNGFYPKEMWEDHLSAARFEARVALWLLDHDYEDVPCAHGMDIFCPSPRPPFVDNGCGKWCLLRCARLAVEQEMDDVDRK